MGLSKKEETGLFTNYGSWAVITGASSGIGRELALLLAKANFNLIINARNEKDLLALKNHLNSKFSVDIKIVAADVSSAEGIQQIKDTAANLKIGLLIASAGFGTSGSFLKNPAEKELNMLDVNCRAVLALAHYFGNRFLSQKRGGIILLSSIVAFQGVPFASNYAATKAYVQTLAEGLSKELRPHGIDVLAAAPGPVETGFGKRANMKMGAALSPKEVAIPILKALGKKTTVFPGALSKFLTYSLKILPRPVKVSVMKRVMKGMAHQ